MFSGRPAPNDSDKTFLLRHIGARRLSFTLHFQAGCGMTLNQQFDGICNIMCSSVPSIAVLFLGYFSLNHKRPEDPEIKMHANMGYQSN